MKLLYSQQANTGSYPEIDGSIPCFHNTFVSDHFKYYTSIDVQLSYVYLPLRFQE